MLLHKDLLVLVDFVALEVFRVSPEKVAERARKVFTFVHYVSYISTLVLSTVTAKTVWCGSSDSSLFLLKVRMDQSGLVDAVDPVGHRD